MNELLFILIAVFCSFGYLALLNYISKENDDE